MHEFGPGISPTHIPSLPPQRPHGHNSAAKPAPSFTDLGNNGAATPNQQLGRIEYNLGILAEILREGLGMDKEQWKLTWLRTEERLAQPPVDERLVTQEQLGKMFEAMDRNIHHLLNRFVGRQMGQPNPVADPDGDGPKQPEGDLASTVTCAPVPAAPEPPQE